MGFLWRDGKRQVNLISSIHNGSSFKKKVSCKPGEGNGGQPFKYIQKLKAIELYTINMGGVDRADQKASYGLNLHRNLKWWKKAFLHMLQVAVVNAVVNAYQDYESSFEVLMERDRSITVHQRNLWRLITEMHKTKNGLNPAFMKEIFCGHESQYNLRNSNNFCLPRIDAVTHGSETIRFRSPQVWATVPQFIKNSASLTEFKTKSDLGLEKAAICQLCQAFIPNLGFI